MLRKLFQNTSLIILISDFSEELEMGNVPEWAVVAVGFVMSAAVGVGVAKSKADTMAKKLQELCDRITSATRSIDAIEHDAALNKPVLDHLHSEAFVVRKKLEDCGKESVILSGRISAVHEKNKDLKEDLNKYVGSVKHDFEKTVADVYKHIDELKHSVTNIRKG